MKSDHFKTEQDRFWAGEFGTRYTSRNQSNNLLASNIAFFSRSLRAARKPANCIEFGANLGMNLRSLKSLFPDQLQFGLEINPEAADKLRNFLPSDNVIEMSILDFVPTQTFDLVLVKGFLIHINSEVLPQVYEILYKSMGHYLLLCEYYNPTPVKIPYRDHDDRMFKRDFCGEVLDRYTDLKLRDYGFVYRRDPNFPQDDITWFLLEKQE